MAVELKPSSHKNMIDILLAFFRSEGYRAGELMVEGARNQCSDIHAFCSAVEDMVHRSHESPCVPPTHPPIFPSSPSLPPIFPPFLLAQRAG